MVVAVVGFLGGWTKQVLGPDSLFLGAALAATVVTWVTFLPSFIFILAGVNPFVAYREIISYAFLNPFGLPLTINRCIFLLLCTYAFIIPYRAGLWNIGMTGQLYMGSLAVFAVVLALGGKAAPSAN